MKIFPKFYTRRLYRVNKLEDILKILEPWIDKVLYKESPFLRQVASYHLRQFGSSSAPRLFKSIVAGEIYRLNEEEDLKASLRAAIVIAYRKYNPAKGNVSLVNWLSWKIPYEMSKWVTWKVTHPIEPFIEDFLPAEIIRFERTLEKERQIGILSEDLNLEKQVKQYYLRKARNLIDATFSE